MDNVYFDSEGLYIESYATNLEKITAINAIQDALLSTAMRAASTGNMTEYMLNDGQTIIKTVYRSAAAVMEAWKSWESIKQVYVNRINGRMVRLVDSKNFILNGPIR